MTDKRSMVTDLMIVEAAYDGRCPEHPDFRQATFDLLCRRTGLSAKVVWRAMERAQDRRLIDCGSTLRVSWLKPAGKALLVKHIMQRAVRQMATILEVNQIYLEQAVEEYGASWNADAHAFLHQKPFRLPAGYLDVTEYRLDMPGVRFVCGGTLFRNFEHPHQAINCTRRVLDLTPNVLPVKVKPEPVSVEKSAQP